LEFGALELGHLETEVEVEWGLRRDPDPDVLTGLLRLGDDAISLDEFTLDSLLFQKSFQERIMMHNVPRHVVHFDSQRKAAEIHVHIVLCKHYL